MARNSWQDIAAEAVDGTTLYHLDRRSIFIPPMLDPPGGLREFHGGNQFLILTASEACIGMPGLAPCVIFESIASIFTGFRLVLQSLLGPRRVLLISTRLNLRRRHRLIQALQVCGGADCCQGAEEELSRLKPGSCHLQPDSGYQLRRAQPVEGG